MITVILVRSRSPLSRRVRGPKLMTISSSDGLMRRRSPFDWLSHWALLLAVAGAVAGPEPVPWPWSWRGRGRGRGRGRVAAVPWPGAVAPPQSPCALPRPSVPASPVDQTVLLTVVPASLGSPCAKDSRSSRREQDPPHVRVTHEDHAQHVKDLAFQPMAAFTLPAPTALTAGHDRSRP